MSSSALERPLLLSLLAVVVLLVLLGSAPGASLPSRDGGIYAYIGSAIVDGKLPYVDAWESKPPGIFYLNALALSLGGRWGIWLFEFLFLFIAAWLGNRVMTLWWGPVPALFGTLLWLSGLLFLGFDGNYTEEYSLPLSFLALLLFSLGLQTKPARLHDLLIGLTAGTGFLFRANNIGVQVAIALVVLGFGLQQREYRATVARLSRMAIGAAVPFLSAATYFAAQGALQPMLDAALIYNFFYTGSHADPVFTAARGFLILNVVALVAAGGYVRLLAEAWRTRLSSPTAPWHALLLVAWPLEMLLSSLSGRAYNHYYICWLPAMGLLGSFAVHSYGKPVVRALSARPLATSYAALVVVLLAGSWSSFKPYSEAAAAALAGRDLPGRIDPVSRYVREHTEPHEKVLVWGAQAGINFLGERDAPSPYFLYPLFIPSPVTIPMADQFLEDLIQAPPVLIVDASASVAGYEVFYSLDPAIRSLQERRAGSGSLIFTAHNLRAVFEFIESQYRPEATIDSMQIYRFIPG